jgi:hypothetical protein
LHEGDKAQWLDKLVHGSEGLVLDGLKEMMLRCIVFEHPFEEVVRDLRDQSGLDALGTEGDALDAISVETEEELCD